MRGRVPVVLLALVGIGLSHAVAGPLALDEADRIRLAELFRIGDRLGDRIWKGWHRAPFAVLLVTPEAEYLVRHPRPPEEYLRLGYDPVLGSEVHAARRTHPLDLLATFPINGVPTIVAGRAEHTQEKTSSRWVAVMLHEHFHQLQYDDPDYHQAVDGLGLAHGDTTGMWMLNYPFPYDTMAIKERFGVMVRALSDALGAAGTEDFRVRFPLYLRARGVFLEALSPEQRRYFAFQTWQEGVAQYTQLRMAELAGHGHTPSREFAALEDFTPFADVGWKIHQDLRHELPNLTLDRYRRVAFYYVGAAEALILDTVTPRWRRRYFKERFSLEGRLTATGYTPGSADAPAPRR